MYVTLWEFPFLLDAQAQQYVIIRRHCLQHITSPTSKWKLSFRKLSLRGWASQIKLNKITKRTNVCVNVEMYGEGRDPFCVNKFMNTMINKL